MKDKDQKSLETLYEKLFETGGSYPLYIDPSDTDVSFGRRALDMPVEIQLKYPQLTIITRGAYQPENIHVVYVFDAISDTLYNSFINDDPKVWRDLLPEMDGIMNAITAIRPFKGDTEKYRLDVSQCMLNDLGTWVYVMGIMAGKHKDIITDRQDVIAVARDKEKANWRAIYYPFQSEAGYKQKLGLKLKVKDYSSEEEEVVMDMFA